MNITFLNPSFLWLLPAGALPLVMHLLSRARPHKTPFSDLRFIKDALRRVQARLKLRRWLLLVLRTLILLLLVLLFARPLLRFGAGPQKDAALSVVLLLDTSYSMRYADGGSSRFERARRQLRRVLDLLPASARVGFIAYADRIEAATPVLGNDREHLIKMVDGVRVTARTTDTARALAAAERLLEAAPSTQKTIVIFSDLAAHGFSDDAGLRDKRIRVIAFAPGGGTNAYLSGIRADFDDAAERWMIEARGRAGEPGDRSLAWYVNGRKRGNDFAQDEAGGCFIGRFACGREDGGVAGYVEMPPDRLADDNRYYFAAARPEGAPTWIIDGDPRFGGASAESYYLRTVFPRAVAMSEAEADRAALTVPGTLILCNIRDDHPRIEQFIRAGGGALVFLGDHCPDGPAAPYLPAEIGTAFTERCGVRWIAKDHDLAARLPLSGFDWDKIAVDRGYVLTPRDGATVCAACSTGRPFMVEGACGRGKVMLVASTAGRHWNNLPTRPVFAPFLKALGTYLAAAPQARDGVMLKVGDTFRMPGALSRKAVIVETPSGQRIGARDAGGEIVFQDTAEPGIYRVLADESELQKFAVNLNSGSGESDVAVVPGAALNRVFRGNPVVLMPEQNWEKRFASVLSGIDAARPIALALLLLLLAEIIVANPRRETAGGGKWER